MNGVLCVGACFGCGPLYNGLGAVERSKKVQLGFPHFVGGIFCNRFLCLPLRLGKYVAYLSPTLYDIPANTETQTKNLGRTMFRVLFGGDEL